MATSYLRVGCYGKLPFRREYLEQNVGYPSSRFFRDWIRAGREKVLLSAKDDDGEKLSVEESAQRRFLVAAAGAPDLAAGIIRPSIDREGRHHPLALFVTVPRRPYSRHYGLLPLATAPLWDALDDAWDALTGVATESAFLEMLDSTRAPAPLPVSDARRQYDGLLEESLDGLLEREDGVDLGLLDQSMPKVLSRLGKDLAGEPVRLELPVSRVVGATGFDAAFWVHLINHQFRWKRFDPWVVLDGAAGERNRVALLGFGELTPADYFEIMRPRVLNGQGDVLELDKASFNAVVRPVHHAGEEGRAGATKSSLSGMTFAELGSRRFR